MSSFRLLIDNELQTQVLQEMLNGKGPTFAVQGAINNLKGMLAGSYEGTVLLEVAPVAASGTVTFAAAATAGDTVVINGVSFLCVASAPAANQFVPGANQAASAANLAAAIQASTSALVADHVSASAAGAVVTLTAKIPGPAGNAVTLADTGADISVSAARLAGGSSVQQLLRFGA